MIGFKDIFNEQLAKKIKDTINIPKVLYFIFITWILFSNILIGMIPSESMYPTLKEKDVVIAVRYKGQNIKRGDIVLIKRNNMNMVYCKRVIGLPYESVIIVDGKVYINSKPLSENYIYEKPDYVMEETIVLEDEFFVLGDNRNNSEDSHIFGNIKKDEIKGIVIMKINLNGFKMLR